jgi:hypothetical protein
MSETSSLGISQRKRLQASQMHTDSTFSALWHEYTLFLPILESKLQGFSFREATV